MGRAAADIRRRGAAGTSEIELRGNLDDAHVLRVVVLPKVGSQNRRAPSRPSIVRSHQAGEVAEYVVSGLARAVGHVAGQVVTRKLRMVELVERLQAEL